MTQPGFARNPTTALQRVALGLAVACFVVAISLTGAKAACESQKAALDGRHQEEKLCQERLQQADLARIAQQGHGLSLEERMSGCMPQGIQSGRAMQELLKCEDRQQKKEQGARDAANAAKWAADERKRDARETEVVRQIHQFTHTVRIGMTAAEVDAAERESFDNPAAWGRTVNTTVTANGTTEQWVYRFSEPAYRRTNDLYLYLRDGVVSAIQK
jgi:hypothetical protein